MFDWFKGRSKTPPGGAAQEPRNPSATTTEFDKADFVISFPFEWKELPCDEGFEFANALMPETCNVVVYHTRKEIAGAEMRTALERMATLRRQGLVDIGGGRSQFSNLEFREGKGQMEARFFGRDEGNEVQIASVVRAHPRKFVQVSLYRHTLHKLGSLPFNDYASVIFDLTNVKDA